MNFAMKSRLEYSFDDEPVSKFCYDISNKRIEVHFTGYYELLKENSFINGSCTFVIENWKEAKSRVGDEERLYELNKHIGVFSMILTMELKDDGLLEMLVSTIDNRYVTFFFKDAQLRLICNS